jgi:Leucine-rich repeat (LRR) protein
VCISDLSSNNLVGTLPASVGNLESLKRLGLTDNDLTGTVPPLLLMSSLTAL